MPHHLLTTLYPFPLLLILLIPPILPSATVTVTATMISLPLNDLPSTSLESTGDYPMICFAPSHQARYIAPVLEDCLTTIREQILCGDKNKAPMDFTTASTGFTVPYTWLDSTCRIGLMPTRPESADTFSLSDVSDRALEIVGRCASGPVFRWGGRSMVGPKNEFNLVVIGAPARPKQDREKPSCWFQGNKNTGPGIPVTYGMGSWIQP